MKQTRARLGIVALIACVSACTTVPLAPGADAVRFTGNAADVAQCTAMGNVKVTDAPEPYTNVERVARNLTVGLNGNTLFVTVTSTGIPPMVTQGIAYHCP